MSEQRCTCGAIDFSECQCSLDDSDSIRIIGSGNLQPLTPEAILDPDDDNLMTEEVDGLLVQLPAYITNPPRVSAYHNAAQSIPDDTGTVVSLNSEYYDSDNMHDTTTDNSRLTVLTPGIYVATFVCAFAGNVTGDRSAHIRKNGHDFLGGSERKALSSTSFECGLNVTVQEWLEEGEYLEGIVKQDSGGALNLNATRYSPVLSAFFRRRVPS